MRRGDKRGCLVLVCDGGCVFEYRGNCRYIAQHCTCRNFDSSFWWQAFLVLLPLLFGASSVYAPGHMSMIQIDRI